MCIRDRFSVPAANVTITGQKQGYNSVVTSNGISGVKLIGPADSISKINPDMPVSYTHLDVYKRQT